MSRMLTVLLVLTLCASSLSADNWSNWRGPTGNGVAPAGKYPTKWSTTDNVAWKMPLPGRGASTPIVWEKQIFLTYAKGGKNVLANVSRDGRLDWETEIGSERAGKNKKASGCNSSAVTDGQSVFAYFKSGDVACVDFSGRIVWQKNLQQQYGEDTLSGKKSWSGTEYSSAPRRFSRMDWCI